MLTREKFVNDAQNFYDWCEYPAVKYKVALDFLGLPYDYDELADLRREFLKSDIVTELRNTQDYDGKWGSNLHDPSDKNPEIKTKFSQCTLNALRRSLYIGLRLEDESDILTLALEYLEEILQDKTYRLLRKYFRGNNEREIPWNVGAVACMIEAISPNHELCGDVFNQWNYIAISAFEDGEYSHERNKKAQHELFGTRENRLVPMEVGFGLLLSKNKERRVSESLEKSMLNYYGRNVYHNGYFWDFALDKMGENPPVFTNKFTQRYFPTIDYINRFKFTRKYLDETVNWFDSSKNQDNLWDYGSQVSFDPWGSWRYFSANKNYKYNRLVNCTMEVLHVFKKYLDNNDL
jgi:hypothetical protein